MVGRFPVLSWAMVNSCQCSIVGKKIHWQVSQLLPKNPVKGWWLPRVSRGEINQATSCFFQNWSKLKSFWENQYLIQLHEIYHQCITSQESSPLISILHTESRIVCTYPPTQQQWPGFLHFLTGNPYKPSLATGTLGGGTIRPNERMRYAEKPPENMGSRCQNRTHPGVDPPTLIPRGAVLASMETWRDSMWDHHCTAWLILLMIQKSCVHQLRLVISHTLQGFIKMPGGSLGFLPSTVGIRKMGSTIPFITQPTEILIGYRMAQRTILHVSLTLVVGSWEL